MKKQNLDEVIPFRLARRQKAALLRIARKSGRAASDILRELVEQRIAQDERAAKGEAAAVAEGSDQSPANDAVGVGAGARGVTSGALGAAA